VRIEYSSSFGEQEESVIEYGLDEKEKVICDKVGGVDLEFVDPDVLVAFFRKLYVSNINLRALLHKQKGPDIYIKPHSMI
jgi:hypothetical protein